MNPNNESYEVRPAEEIALMDKNQNRAMLKNKAITVSAVFLPIIIGYFMGGKKGALIGGGLVVVSVVGFAAYLSANWK